VGGDSAVRLRKDTGLEKTSTNGDDEGQESQGRDGPSKQKKDEAVKPRRRSPQGRAKKKDKLGRSYALTQEREDASSHLREKALRMR